MINFWLNNWAKLRTGGGGGEGMDRVPRVISELKGSAPLIWEWRGGLRNACNCRTRIRAMWELREENWPFLKEANNEII